MTLVVDASVALKWVLDEDGSDRARQILQTDVLLAPDLMWIEFANVLWVYVRRGLISRGDAEAAREALEAAPITALPSRPLLAAAHRAAFDLGHAVYECVYLAAAVDERATLVTADAAFAAKAGASDVYGAFVRAL